MKRVLSHSYVMDVIPALLTDEQEWANIARCTALLEAASGRKVEGLAQSARYFAGRDAAPPRRGRLPLVRRRVRRATCLIRADFWRQGASLPFRSAPM